MNTLKDNTDFIKNRKNPQQDRLYLLRSWFCGCIVGIISLGLGGEVFKLGGVTIHSIIESHSHMSMPALYTAMAVGIVLCAAEAVLSKFAELYFKNELADGTPFTMRDAKELMRLGILTIIIPLGMVIVCSIGVAIADNFFPEIEKLLQK